MEWRMAGGRGCSVKVAKYKGEGGGVGVWRTGAVEAKIKITK